MDKLKTSYGKLTALCFVLLAAVLLFAPMRAGQEDVLELYPGTLKMSVGGSYRASCTLRSDVPGQSLHYEVENPGVARIAADGTVEALSPGETIITARASGGARARMKVIVDGTPLTELELNTDAVYIDKGQFSGLRVHYNADATDPRLQWVSADESIATVDAAGRIEGVGGGVTTVSVISPGGRSASATVFVNVDGAAVHITPNSLTLGVGAQVPLSAAFLPEDSTDRVVRWASSDRNILTVDEGGLLSAVGEGRAFVSVFTEDGLTDGMEVLVEAAPGSLRLDPAAATIERGESLDLHLHFLDDDGSPQADVNHLISWISSDPGVAAVDENGRVTALSSGKCEISAVCDGLTAVCELQVQTTVREIRLDRSESYLLREQAGTPIQLSWELVPSDSDDPVLRFASNNPQVANVSDSGLVTLTGGYGSAVVTASSASGATASFAVHVVTQLPENNLAAANPVLTVEEITDFAPVYAENGIIESVVTGAAPVQGGAPAIG